MADNKPIDKIEEFNSKMYDLIDAIKDGDIQQLKQHKDQIEEVAALCRGTRIYQKVEAETLEFTKDMNAEDCYGHMLDRIAEAPTQLHAIISAKVLLPVISDKLKQGTS